MSELVSRTTRGLFRDLMANSTLGEIGAAFQDELFAPNPDSTYEDGSVRRQLTQEYLEAVDWTDVNHIDRVLRVFERLMQVSLASRTGATACSPCRQCSLHLVPVGAGYSR
jgi:hypothetical protein